MKISEIIIETKLEEVSQELKDKYVDRATTAHSGYNMARRNTTGKEQEVWTRKERNTKRGISRALKDTEIDNPKN